jgi:hypothetical protein
MRALGFRDMVESTLAGVAGVAAGASDDGTFELEGVAGNGGSGRWVGGAGGAGIGTDPLAYCLSSSSHRARRSWRSWFGRRRLRAGAGVLGVQVTLA